MIDPAFDKRDRHPFNADRMRALMRQRHMTLADVADAARVSEFTLKKWGKRTPMVAGDGIVRVAERLLVQPWDLVTSERVDHKRHVNRGTHPEFAAELARLFDVGTPPTFARLATLSEYGKITESSKRNADIIEVSFVTTTRVAGVDQVLLIRRVKGPHIVTTGTSILQSCSPAVLPRDCNELQDEFRREVALPRGSGSALISHLGWLRNRVKDRSYYFWLFHARVVVGTGLPTLPMDPGDSAEWSVPSPAVVDELRSEDGQINRADRATCDLLGTMSVRPFADEQVTVIAGTNDGNRLFG